MIVDKNILFILHLPIFDKLSMIGLQSKKDDHANLDDWAFDAQH